MNIVESSIEVYKNMAEARTQDCINYQKEIKHLKQENEALKTIINNIANYIDRMSYQAVIDNPRQDLVRILDKEK